GADGTLLYQVVRLEPKDFRARQPNGNGGWVWKLPDQRVVYRWRDLLQFPDATIFVTEGEKDSNRLADLKLCATTVAAGKWTDDCIKALAGRDIVILEDNDDAGRKKSLEAAQALYGAANSIRLVALPDLPEKGDVSDWLDADPRRADKLAEVCCSAPLWKPEDSPDCHGEQDTAPDSSKAALPFLVISEWQNKPVPERQWTVKDRV